MLVKKSSNECEEQPEVNYVIAIGTNKQLKLRASDIITKAKHEYGEKLAPITELIDSCFEKNEDLEEVRKLVPNSTWCKHSGVGVDKKGKVCITDKK